MGLRLKIIPATASLLKIGDTVTYSGLLDFDNSTGVYEANHTADINGNRTVQWKMWLDSSAQLDFSPLLTIGDNGPVNYDGVYISWDDSGSRLRVICDPSTYSGNRNLIVPSNSYGKILNCELKKTTRNCVYIKFDDVSLGEDSVAFTGFAEPLAFGMTSTSDVNSRFREGTIWDIKVINDDSSTLLHHWKGYPNGDTPTAWEDQVGSEDPSVWNKTGHTPSTRTISGVDERVSGVSSNLLIAPPDSPPDAPTLYRPLDGSTLGTIDPSLAWLENEDTSTYWVQVDDSSDFSSTLYDVSGLTGLYYDVSDLSYSTNYYWRVAATNPTGTGSWSEERVFTTPAQPSSFPTSGLEAYWDFEASSGTISDKTSNSNDLPTNTGVTYSQTGKIDDCVSITGSGYLQGTSDTVGTVAFSISAWVKTPDVADQKTIFACENGPWTAGYNFSVNSAGYPQVSFFTEGAGQNIHTETAVDDDTWHHLVVTYDGTGTSATDAKFYIDGSLQTTNTSGWSRQPVANVGGTFRIGNWTFTTDYGLNGEIDETGFWSTVLTATDVSTLYNNGNALAYPGP